MKSSLRTLLILSAAASLAGCGADDSYGFGTVSFAMQGCPHDVQDGRILKGTGTCSFQLEVLRGEWRDEANKPEEVFSSNCERYTGDLVTISNFPAGEALTIHIETFSDGACKDRVLTGLRGGVKVREGADAGGIWFVPTLFVDGFTELPSLSQKVRGDADKVSCSADEDCRKVGDGGSFEISPIAQCGEEGKCQLPRSLFPLNMDAPRAFHGAVALEDGRIVLVGGLSRDVTGDPEKAARRFFATDETLEIFDPVTMNWSRATIKGLSGLRLAMPQVVSLGGNAIGVIGGAQQLDLELRASVNAEERYLAINSTEEGNLADVAIWANIDGDGGSSQAGALGSPRLGPNASVVKVDGGHRVLVSGGLEPMGAGVRATDVMELCVMDADGVKCAPHGALSSARSGHCSYCLEGDDGCERLLLIGGLPTETPEETVQKSLGDLWRDGTVDSIGLFPSGLDTNVVYPTCVRSVGFNYLLGGMPSNKLPPAIDPVYLQLSADFTQVGSVDLTDADTLQHKNLVHGAAVALEDGSVLVTGGLDRTGNSVRSAYLITGGDVKELLELRRPRFGHTATLIQAGPLRGAVLVAGGMISQGGELKMALGAEIYVP